MAYFSLSVFACDFCNVERDIKRAEKANADFLHFDVMDGHFVPLLGLGTTALSSVKGVSNLLIDIHLMTKNLDVFIPQFFQYKVNTILFHVEMESKIDILKFLRLIKDENIRAGLVVSPNTDISILKEYLPFLDEVLIMSAMPGIMNGIFEDSVFERIKKVKEMIDTSNVIISVDGRLDDNRAMKCLESGAQKIVIGRAFFKSHDAYNLVKTIREWR